MSFAALQIVHNLSVPLSNEPLPAPFYHNPRTEQRIPMRKWLYDATGEALGAVIGCALGVVSVALLKIQGRL
jgi:hypothetical protein